MVGWSVGRWAVKVTWLTANSGGVSHAYKFVKLDRHEHDINSSKSRAFCVLLSRYGMTYLAILQYFEEACESKANVLLNLVQKRVIDVRQGAVGRRFYRKFGSKQNCSKLLRKQ